MNFFKNRNESLEYLSLLNYQKNIEIILQEDKYISKKEYISFYNNNKDIYEKINLMDKENVLQSWCKKQKTDYNKLKQLMKYYNSTENTISKHNNNYIEKHLISDKKYLDTILIKDDPNIILDEEQRKVVLSDEDYTLVIAGAGAGKTTTIEAKVKYLIDKKNIDPKNILIISFTKKATNELQERCTKLGLPVIISTFHSISNTIIKGKEEQKHRIATGEIMFASIKKFLLNISNDEILIRKILLFFASYLQVPIDENNVELLLEQLNNNDCTTLRNDIEKLLYNYNEQQLKNKKTLNDEKVRSIEECRIANFLFINNIDYEYEPTYRYGFNNTIKPYTPDFLIKQYDKEIYIEHFGISEEGKNNRFNHQQLEEYKKQINDKIKLHKQHNTKLIYTFSNYKDGKDTITHLKEELIKAGISFEQKNSKEIYNTIIKNIEDKYFNKLIQLICVFISRFKTNNYTPSKFDEWKITLEKDERSKLFIDICYQCYLAYMTDLKNHNSIDFEDMINNAINVLDNMIEHNEKLPYKYILVDEYQDISMQRFDLCEKLSKCSDAKIIAVGDDWQSIFRFSGAKIELFTKFEELMGYANILKITKTYRNSKELIDIAGGFVMENHDQIKKSLKSNKTIKNPVILMSYDDSYIINEKNEGPFMRMGNAIEKSLDAIVKQGGPKQNILFIGRYGFEGYLLEKFTKLFTYSNGHLSSIKYPQLKITYLTAHSSKGLGYDNVIIINGKDAVLGFPSKIIDDPIMKLVIKDTENFDFAEERRLFYVALTRTKNRIFIITPKYRPSTFILELIEKYKDILLIGEELSPTKKYDNKLECPICGYPLQKRINNNYKIKNKVWICSNDPELCGFVTNDLHGGKLAISKCPNCNDGYLIIKSIKHPTGNISYILGCNNYKKDNTGCNTYLTQKNYTQDKETLNIKFYNKNNNLDNIYYCGRPFKDLIGAIFEVINSYKNCKVSLGPRTLFAILSGGTTKFIESFKAYNHPKYNYININDKKKFYALLQSLKEENIIKVDEENYGKIIILKEKLDENDLKIIYGGMKI